MASPRAATPPYVFDPGGDMLDLGDGEGARRPAKRNGEALVVLGGNDARRHRRAIDGELNAAISKTSRRPTRIAFKMYIAEQRSRRVLVSRPRHHAQAVRLHPSRRSSRARHDFVVHGASRADIKLRRRALRRTGRGRAVAGCSEDLA